MINTAMEADPSLDMIGRTLLVAGLIILPCVYIWIVLRLHKTNVTSPTDLDFFAGCGTLGGMLLFFAMHSYIMAQALITIFQILVAVPFSLVCLFRVASRNSGSDFRRLAISILLSGVFITLGSLTIWFVR